MRMTTRHQYWRTNPAISLWLRHLLSIPGRFEKLSYYAILLCNFGQRVRLGRQWGIPMGSFHKEQ